MFCSMDNTISTLSNYCQVCQFTVLYLWYFFLETNIQPNKIVNVKYSSKKVEKKVNKSITLYMCGQSMVLFQ